MLGWGCFGLIRKCYWEGSTHSFNLSHHLPPHNYSAKPANLVAWVRKYLNREKDGVRWQRLESACLVTPPPYQQNPPSLDHFVTCLGGGGGMALILGLRAGDFECRKSLRRGARGFPSQNPILKLPIFEFFHKFHPNHWISFSGSISPIFLPKSTNFASFDPLFSEK